MLFLGETEHFCGEIVTFGCMCMCMWTNPSKNPGRGQTPPIQAMPVFWERMERQPLPKLGKDWKCLSDNVFVFWLARAFNGRVAYWAVLILCYHKLIACQRTIKECLSECSKFTLLVGCRCTIWIRISSCPSSSIWYRVYTIHIHLMFFFIGLPSDFV